MLICDTSGLIAFFDKAEREHMRVRAVIDAEPGPFVISPYVVAEVDYLVLSRYGVERELFVLTEIFGGGWEQPCLTSSERDQARIVLEHYRDMDVGLADASIVVLATRFNTDRVLTLDRRHFRALRTQDGRAFAVLPE